MGCVSFFHHFIGKNLLERRKRMKNILERRKRKKNIIDKTLDKYIDELSGVYGSDWDVVYHFLKEAPLLYKTNCTSAQFDYVVQLLIHMMEKPDYKEKLLDIFIEVILEYAMEIGMTTFMVTNLNTSLHSICFASPIVLYYDTLFSSQDLPEYQKCKDLIYEKKVAVPGKD